MESQVQGENRSIAAPSAKFTSGTVHSAPVCVAGYQTLEPYTHQGKCFMKKTISESPKTLKKKHLGRVGDCSSREFFKNHLGVGNYSVPLASSLVLHSWKVCQLILKYKFITEMNTSVLKISLYYLRRHMKFKGKMFNPCLVVVLWCP